jgi:CubicO group peptidase (beta-lactamase class C family)
MPAKGWRALVNIHPTEDVARVGIETHHDRRMDGVWRDVLGLYKTGLHPAIALHVRHKGRVILDRTVGHLDNAPGGGLGEVVTPDSLFNLFSASKIVTASLVHALVDDGLLDLDLPAVTWVPEFGRHGKEAVLLRHLLNHTGGFPDMPAGLDVGAILASGKIDMDVIWDLPLQTPPGQRVAYNPVAAWFVVQTILERVSGKPLRQLLYDRLLSPLGFKNLNYGVEASRVPEVALHAVTGPPTPPFMANIFQRSIGMPLEQAVTMTNDAQFLTAVLPSANVIATPREVSRFLAMLLGEGQIDGQRVMRPETVRRMVGEVTPRQFDATFGFPMRYGLGVMMGGRRFSLFGLNTSNAFGHLGLSTVVVFADPSRDLVVTFLNTGKPMMDHGMLRWYWVLQRIVTVIPKI